MKGKMVVLSFIVLTAIVCSSTCYTVHESEHAILMHFGKPSRQPIVPGLHFKWPIADTVQRYDRRLHVCVTTAITHTLKDKKTIILQGYMCWRISDPLKFYESVRSTMEAEQKLNHIASSALGNHISEYPITAIVSTDAAQVRLGEIERTTRDEIAVRIKAEYGVTLDRFGINRLALPVANEQTVYDRMKSERNVAAQEYRTEGEREAMGIRARAKRAADETTAKAYADATRIRGDGEAKATQIYRDAYSQDPEFYQFWRTLETYKRVFGPDTTLVIPPDSELMKYFRMPNAAGKGTP